MTSDIYIGTLSLVCMFLSLVSAENERAFYYRNRANIILNCLAALCAVIAIAAFTGALR